MPYPLAEQVRQNILTELLTPAKTRQETLKTLQASGLHTNVDGKTPVYFLARQGINQLPSIKWLLSQGASFKHAMLGACESQDKALITSLFQQGANNDDKMEAHIILGRIDFAKKLSEILTNPFLIIAAAYYAADKALICNAVSQSDTLEPWLKVTVFALAQKYDMLTTYLQTLPPEDKIGKAYYYCGLYGFNLDEQLGLPLNHHSGRIYWIMGKCQAGDYDLADDIRLNNPRELNAVFNGLARGDHRAMLAYLLKACPESTDKGALLKAAFLGAINKLNYNLIEYLFTLGLDIDYVVEALFKHQGEHDIQLLRLIEKYQALKIKRFSDSDTLLHLAAKHGKEEVVLFLLSQNEVMLAATNAKLETALSVLPPDDVSIRKMIINELAIRLIILSICQADLTPAEAAQYQRYQHAYAESGGSMQTLSAMRINLKTILINIAEQTAALPSALRYQVIETLFPLDKVPTKACVMSTPLSFNKNYNLRLFYHVFPHDEGTVANLPQLTSTPSTPAT